MLCFGLPSITWYFILTELVMPRFGQLLQTDEQEDNSAFTVARGFTGG